MMCLNFALHHILLSHCGWNQVLQVSQQIALCFHATDFWQTPQGYLGARRPGLSSMSFARTKRYNMKYDGNLLGFPLDSLGL